jgi:hypothetical protein
MGLQLVLADTSSSAAHGPHSALGGAPFALTAAAPAVSGGSGSVWLDNHPAPPPRRAEAPSARFLASPSGFVMQRMAALAVMAHATMPVAPQLNFFDWDGSLLPIYRATHGSTGEVMVSPHPVIYESRA